MLKRIISAVLIVVLSSTIGVVASSSNRSDSDFVRKMESLGFTISDMKEYTDDVEGYVTALQADSSSLGYSIYYYSFEDAGVAKKAYKERVKLLAENLEYANDEKQFFNSYWIQIGPDYEMVARAGNTYVYCCTDKEYYEEVSNLLREIGY